MAIINLLLTQTHVNTKDVLIVEDDTAILEVLVELLKFKGYNVRTAVNGVKGLAAIEKKIPNLLLLDIMMPEMNGFELLKRIRSKQKTELLPVIILTAKVDLESQITGLSLGADDFIVKPFEFDVLDLKIKNLINKQSKMINNGKKAALNSSSISDTLRSILVGSREIAFINNLNAILDQQLSDPKLSIADISNSLNISSSTFNRKLKKACNITPNTYLMHYRLNRAKEMIHSDSGNISQIAVKIGFSSLSYFSIQYKKYFGSNPSRE